MIDAIFLNPLTKTQLKSGGRKHKVKSPTLKGWQSMVKKHGGDLKAAAREWKSRSTSGSKSRRGAAASKSSSSRKGLSGLAARRAASSSKRAKGGVPMAARKKTKRRRRNTSPPEPRWMSQWRSGMTRFLGRTPKGPKFRKISRSVPKGTEQWKSRTKRGLTKSMRSHARSGRRGAADFSAAVIRGARASSKLNPMTPARWASRYARTTGFYPGVHSGVPGTTEWGRRVVRGVKRGAARKYSRRVSTQRAAQKYEKGLIAAMKREFPALKRAKNPRRKTRRKGSRRMRNQYPMISAAQARRLALVPYKRKSKKRKTKRSYSRRKNPVADSLRAMFSTESAMKYAYATGGVAVGGVFPALVSRYIWKGAQRSQMVESLVGLGGTVLAGLGVSYATKDDNNGILVMAGGLAGVVGNILINQLSKILGVDTAAAGLGQSAEDALKMAVEQEMQRAGLTGGVGQFLLPGEAETVDGMGQFLTEPEMETSIATTEGFGDINREDLVSSGSAAFAGIDGSMF